MEARLLDHLTSRINADLDLLVELRHLQPNDAAVIRSRLPVISTPASAPLSIAAPQQQQVSLPPQQVSVGRVVPAIPAATKPQTPKNLARALWDYSSATPGDLNFAKGDVIEILAEENEHWWRGRHSAGAEGLFPTNHVERMQDPANLPQNGIVPHSNAFVPPASAPVDQKFQQMQIQPQQYHASPPQQQQQPIVVEQKNSRRSDLKNTLMHAGVGGIGFGAGSSLVNSIF